LPDAISQVNLVTTNTTQEITATKRWVDKGIVIGDDYRGDASFHITRCVQNANGTRVGRLTQMQPHAIDGLNQKAENLIASIGTTTTAQWWAWGVSPAHEFFINSGSVMNVNSGLRINAQGHLFEAGQRVFSPNNPFVWETGTIS